MLEMPIAYGREYHESNQYLVALIIKYKLVNVNIRHEVPVNFV